LLVVHTPVLLTSVSMIIVSHSYSRCY